MLKFLEYFHGCFPSPTKPTDIFQLPRICVQPQRQMLHIHHIQCKYANQHVMFNKPAVSHCSGNLYLCLWKENGKTAALCPRRMFLLHTLNTPATKIFKPNSENYDSQFSVQYFVIVLRVVLVLLVFVQTFIDFSYSYVITSVL